MSDHFPSVDDVIQHFDLNYLQSLSFKIAPEAFLCRIAGAYSEKFQSEPPPSRKFTMFLGREGGTVKSRVISALQYFTRMWRRAYSVRTCTPTGIAASLVLGQTVHSLLGICASRKYNPRKKPSQQMIEEYADILLVIVDEISMLPRKALGAWDLFFWAIKEVDQPFGRVMMLFRGDFFQIPHVANDPFYFHPSGSHRPPHFLDILGYHIY